MSKGAVEIKLGNVVYQVERKFVGNVSREELLLSRLLERSTEVVFSAKSQSKPESKRQG